jgi:spermidine synthase
MWLDLDLIQVMLRENAAPFAAARYGSIQVPTYPCGQLGAVVAAKAGGHVKKGGFDITKPVRSVPQDMELRFYTEQMHGAMFVLPKFVEDAIASKDLLPKRARGSAK